MSPLSDHGRWRTVKRVALGRALGAAGGAPKPSLPLGNPLEWGRGTARSRIAAVPLISVPPTPYALRTASLSLAGVSVERGPLGGTAGYYPKQLSFETG